MSGASALLDAQARRWAAVDPLLPAPPAPPSGTPLTAGTPRGPAAGVLLRATHPAGSVSRMWSAAHVSELVAVVGDSGRAGAEALLDQWRRALPGLGLPDEDSACVVSWPSRDVEVGRALLDHGFVPLAVVAVRTPLAPDPPAPAPVGTVVRRAEPADLDDCVRLAMAEQAYSALVGGTVARPDADALKRSLLQARLHRGEPLWVVQRDGVVLGLAECGYSEAEPGSWVAGRLPAGRWGYVNCASVLAGARGIGVGRALMATVHAAFAEQGAIGSYLYYNPPNPLSSVFWPRQGYRPLWTVWEVRPASALR